MATWRDGAAYAPVARPDGFAAPVAPELSIAPPRDPGTPGEVPPPAAMTAPKDTLPLGAVAAQPRDARNPREAFSVATALLTAASTERDPRQPIMTSAPRQSPVGDELPPPTGAPLAPPMGDPFAPPPPHGRTAQQGSLLPPSAGTRSDWPAPTPIQAGRPEDGRAGPPAQFGPPGQWKHLPAPPPPALTTPQRTISGVCMFLFAAGILFPATTPILITIAGGLLLRLPGRLGRLGRTAALVGALGLGWGIATDTLLDGSLLLRFLAGWLLAFTIVNTVSPANNARP